MKLIDLAVDADRGRELARRIVIRENAPSIKFEVRTVNG